MARVDIVFPNSQLLFGRETGTDPLPFFLSSPLAHHSRKQLSSRQKSLRLRQLVEGTGDHAATVNVVLAGHVVGGMPESKLGGTETDFVQHRGHRLADGVKAEAVLFENPSGVLQGVPLPKMCLCSHRQ